MAEDNNATDEPLKFEVVEKKKKFSKVPGTYRRITATKPSDDMTDEESRIAWKVNNDHDIPDDAEDGDTFTPEELSEALDKDKDFRLESDKEQDAIKEAKASGEPVTVWKKTDYCDGSVNECSTDIVRKVATPKGEIEKRRTHTY